MVENAPSPSSRPSSTHVDSEARASTSLGEAEDHLSTGAGSVEDAMDEPDSPMMLSRQLSPPLWLSDSEVFESDTEIIQPRDGNQGHSDSLGEDHASDLQPVEPISEPTPPPSDICDVPVPAPAPSRPIEVIDLVDDSDEDDDALRAAIAMSLSEMSGKQDCVHWKPFSDDDTLQAALAMSRVETPKKLDINVGKPSSEKKDLPIASPLPASSIKPTLYFAEERVELERQRLARAAAKRPLDLSIASPSPSSKRSRTSDQPRNTIMPAYSDYPPKFLNPQTNVTFIAGLPQGSSIRFEELVDRRHLRKAVLSAYQYDDEWLLSRLPAPNTGCSIVMIRPSRGSVPSVYGTRKDVQLCFPELLAGRGCMHVKLMLLFYRGFLRVVVTSANLVRYDWHQLENVLWVQDFPCDLDRVDAPPASRFGREVDGLLKDMGLHHSVLKAVGKADFRNAEARLVVSRPGRHAGADGADYGHLRLAAVVKDLRLPSMNPETANIMYQVCANADLVSPFLSSNPLSPDVQRGKLSHPLAPRIRSIRVR
ncbi:hypothetical protein HKX48_009165 [Thoreauomyces humboldtii]|nr:hypothetical protein HKX48_009165 [Thoreauomyces humboldtii]